MDRNPCHILIVEDENKIAALLSDYLKKEDYKVTILNRGDRVLPFMTKNDTDLILLDLMLPGLSGKQVCREIRKTSDVPIIMLTARVKESDILSGLGIGADDYICKPFSPREVVARIKAVLRRSRMQTSTRTIRIGPFRLNPQSREIKVNETPLKMTPNEYGILKTMILEPNTVLSRERLIRTVQGYYIDGYNRTIDTHVKNLRKKIARVLPDQDVIQSVYGVGYCFKIDE